MAADPTMGFSALEKYGQVPIAQCPMCVFTVFGIVNFGYWFEQIKETVKPEFDSNSNHNFVNAKYFFRNTY